MWLIQMIGLSIIWEAAKNLGGKSLMFSPPISRYATVYIILFICYIEQLFFQRKKRKQKLEQFAETFPFGKLGPKNEYYTNITQLFNPIHVWVNNFFFCFGGRAL